MRTVDDILQQIVQRYGSAFPARVRGFYVYGSQIDGSAVGSSDIDITVVFKGSFIDEAEKQTAYALSGSLVIPIKTDIEVVDEPELFVKADPAFKLASVCFAGEDVRDQVPLMPIAVWTRDRMHTSYWRIVNLFKRPTPVVLPLEYPDVDDEFYGYIRAEKPDDDINTRNLVRSVTWAATALIALKARQYVTRKADCYRLYQQYVGDAWGVLIEDVYTHCKLAWNYAIPDDRSALRELCGRVLAFEHHFMTTYRDFVIGELRSADENAVKQAKQILSLVPCSDSVILDALAE